MHKTRDVNTAEGEEQLVEKDIPRSGRSESHLQSSSRRQPSYVQPQCPRTSPSVEEDRSSNIQHPQLQLQSPNLLSTGRICKRRRGIESTPEDAHFSTTAANTDHVNQAVEIKRLKQVIADKDVQLADKDSVIVEQKAQITKGVIETNLLKELLNNGLRGNSNDNGSKTSELP